MEGSRGASPVVRDAAPGTVTRKTGSPGRASERTSLPADRRLWSEEALYSEKDRS
jgi:hypothetical protein